MYDLSPPFLRAWFNLFFVDKYPIVLSFHYWQFLYGELPDLWADIDILPDAESQAT